MGAPYIYDISHLRVNSYNSTCVTNILDGKLCKSWEGVTLY